MFAIHERCSPLTNSSPILYKTEIKANLNCHALCLLYVLVSETMNVSDSSTLKQVKKGISL